MKERTTQTDEDALATIVDQVSDKLALTRTSMASGRPIDEATIQMVLKIALPLIKAFALKEGGALMVRFAESEGVTYQRTSADDTVQFILAVIFKRLGV